MTDASPAHHRDAGPEQPVVLVSNRGPVSYTLGEDGTLDAKRGGGGLVSGLSAVDDKLWVFGGWIGVAPSCIAGDLAVGCANRPGDRGAAAVGGAGVAAAVDS
ncbi:MAG: hypothetical protein REI11_17185, partial [Patulibacter sp.]|nr:hypothetical protein [Patulibacter sp.]